MTPEARAKQVFLDHSEQVKADIPADRLLVFEMKDGWEPLCGFLGAPLPDTPFPRSNNRDEFWSNFDHEPADA